MSMNMVSVCDVYQYACARGYIWRPEVEVGWIVSITLSTFIWKQSFNLKLLALASLVGQ